MADILETAPHPARTGWTLVGFLCLGLVGCNGDEGAGKPSGLHLTGIVQDLELNTERQDFSGIPGVRVCIYPDQTICGTSNSTGGYVIQGVPENEELILSYEHPDYVPTLRMLFTRENNVILLAPSVMGSVALADRLATEYMFEAIDGRGSLQFFAMHPTTGVLQLQELSGFTVELKDLDGNIVLNPDAPSPLPFDVTYASDEGVPNPQLTASSRRGVGGIANIPPGEYELIFSHPDLVCTQKLEEAGWATDTPYAARFQIFDAWVTGMVGIVCQRAP